MYIKQAFKGENDWWTYLVGVVIIGIAMVVGSVPHAIAIFSIGISDDNKLNSMQDPYELLGMLDSNLNLFLMLLSFAVGLLAIFFVVKFIHHQTLKSLTTSRNRIDWNRFWFAFILWGSIVVVMIGVDYFINPGNFIFNFKLVPFLILFVISIIFIPLQTSCEEYLFRGYLMQGLGILSKNRWFPLIFTSILFGALHIANPEIDKLGNILLVHYIGTGFLLGIMTLMDEGLELSLGFHAANNLVACLLLTADWTVFQTNSILKDISSPELISLGEIFVPIFIIYPFVLYVLSKKYNWSNWGEKLFGRVTDN